MRLYIEWEVDFYSLRLSFGKASNLSNRLLIVVSSKSLSKVSSISIKSMINSSYSLKRDTWSNFEIRCSTTSRSSTHYKGIRPPRSTMALMIEKTSLVRSRSFLFRGWGPASSSRVRKTY